MSESLLPLRLLLAALLASIPLPAATGQEVEAEEEEAIRAAVANVAPSVVQIETVGGLEKVGQVLIGTGPTTGLVVDADGWILSSAFNFVQQPSSILVTLADGKRLPARRVATDHSRMLVLLKVESEAKLPVPESAPPDKVRVGQWAVAVGRTFSADQQHLQQCAEPRVDGFGVPTARQIFGRFRAFHVPAFDLIRHGTLPIQ